MALRLGKQVPCLLEKVLIAARTRRAPGVTLRTLAKVSKVAANDIFALMGVNVINSAYGKGTPGTVLMLRALGEVRGSQCPEL